ncbi:DUF2207 domain-containing protein [Bacillus sp. S/N-304-OC-R1]|uniref:DUF2207 domain-containing protein n=1 Tax=Bacillus sp. S/N-304-OC-R1 TaxID=2758034 RepID=UPI001C8DEFD9|nr:DUF2207 domain-containing protein [Bacillus sp. S/N-304-OC-R1]MBY0124366.1 DUF2207 domain-containing protein [Bacillus sp. S/N-304-OC-R1]
MKKFTITVLTSIIILFFSHSAQVAAKSFLINQVDIHAFILDNGDLYVEELFTYEFEGQFNGTTRTIGVDDHQGIQFFEGYLAPPSTNLLSYDSGSFKPLKVERENLTFKIHTASKDETKKVFYRYLIKGAVTKYKDTGQFYWRFFDEMNESDLHHITIRMTLYNDSDRTLKGYAFLHDLTGGSLEKSKQDGIIYMNELLPAGKTAELRFLFPEDYLKNARFTEEVSKLEEFLLEEEKYQKWFEKRTAVSPIVDGIDVILFITVFSLLLVTVFYPRRIIRLFHRGLPVEELEKLDSFILANLYRKGKLQHSDIISALFRLYQKGIISIGQETARPAYLEDEEAPDYTYRFTLLKHGQKLTQYEQDLIDWLFVTVDSGQRVFSLDDLPFPTKTEKQKNWRLEEEYKQAEAAFHSTFKKWKETVLADSEIKKYVRVNPIRKWFVRLGIPLWIAYSLLSTWMGKADLFDMLLIVLLLLAGGAVYFLKRHKRSALSIYLLAGSLATGLFTFEISDMYAIFSAACIMIAFIVPVYDITLKAVPFYKGIKAFRKTIATGQFTFKVTNSDKWFQHALSLNLFIELKYRYTSSFSESAEGFSPIFKISSETADIFSYPHHYYYHRYSSYNSSGSSGNGSSGGSGGGGGAGAF